MRGDVFVKFLFLSGNGQSKKYTGRKAGNEENFMNKRTKTKSMKSAKRDRDNTRNERRRAKTKRHLDTWLGCTTPRGGEGMGFAFSHHIQGELNN